MASTGAGIDRSEAEALVQDLEELTSLAQAARVANVQEQPTTEAPTSPERPATSDGTTLPTGRQVNADQATTSTGRRATADDITNIATAKARDAKRTVAMAHLEHKIAQMDREMAQRQARRERKLRRGTFLRLWTIQDSLTNVLIILVPLLWFLYSREIDVPADVECPVHSRDALRNGSVPSPYQEAFGKAAWHIPEHWRTWAEFNIFQDPVALKSSGIQQEILDQAMWPITHNMTRTLSPGIDWALERASSALSNEATSMLSCAGDEIQNYDKVAANPRMSITCRTKVFLYWYGLRGLAMSLGSSDGIMDVANISLSRVSKARAELATSRTIFRQIRGQIADSVESKIQSTVRDELEGHVARSQQPFSWSANSTKNGVDKSLRFRTTYLRRLKKEYLAVVWLDLIFASLESALALRQQQLEHILKFINQHEIAETLDSVRHVLQTNQYKSAWNGVIDLLPHRTANFLSELHKNTTIDDQRGFQHGACAWSHEHMPIHVNCTCTQTEKKSLARLILEAREEKHRRATQIMNHWYWEELEHAKIWWDSSMEAGKRVDEAYVKVGTPDIRTVKFCRKEGSRDRAFNVR